MAAPRTHGLSKTRTWKAWHDMVSRCTNPYHPAWPWYRRHGITVCTAWLDFGAFYADMGPKPPGMVIIRLDPAGPYGPDNCRWAAWDEARSTWRMRGPDRRPRRRAA